MILASHGKRIRQIYFCKNILHEKYLIKFRFEKLCGAKIHTKADNLLIIAELLSSRRVIVFLFIMNKPLNKQQDVEMFC